MKKRDFIYITREASHASIERAEKFNINSEDSMADRKEMVVEGYEWPIQHDLDGNELGAYWYSDAMSDLLEDGDWLKLRQISVRWAVPQDLAAKFGFERASIYSSIRNLKIWSKNSMIDPELNGVRSGGNLALGGESSVTLSPSRQFRFGVEVGF